MGKGGFALRLWMKRMLLAVLAAAMSLVLSGCFVKTVDELYTLPKHSDEYNRLEQAIDQVMSSQNASYAAPVSGMNQQSVQLADLDGDGTVEIPTQPDEAGLLKLSQSRRMDFIVWMDYTSRRPEKSFGLLDEETNCYIELPTEWEGNLKLTDSEQYDGAVELRTVDENKLVLTVRLASNSADAAGWTRLGMVASRQMQAKLAPDVEIQDADYSLSNALYLLN